MKLPESRGTDSSGFAWDRLKADLERADQCLQDGLAGEAARIVADMEGRLELVAREACAAGEGATERVVAQLARTEELLSRCESVGRDLMQELEAWRALDRYAGQDELIRGPAWLSEQA
jgi:hypothetical protein